MQEKKHKYIISINNKLNRIVKQNHIGNWVFFLIVCLFIIPALYYSIKTPFALIDDYGDWGIVYLVKNWSFFKIYIRDTFLSNDPGRYNPFYQWYNVLTWSVFGPIPWLHHLMRWVMKFIAWYFWIRCLFLFTEIPAKKVLSKTQSLSRKIYPYISKTSLPFWVFTILFVFFPNTPESRLAPVEIHTSLFLAIINYGIAQLILFYNGDLTITSRKTLLLIYLGFIGLSLSKESNIAFLFAIFVSILFIQRKWFSLKVWMRIITLVLIFVYTLLRVKAAFHGGGYGVPTITSHLLIKNSIWLFNSIFQLETQIIIGIGFIFFIIYRLWWIKIGIAIRTTKMSLMTKENAFIIILIAEFIMGYAVLLTSKSQVLRYWFPLIPILAFMIALSVKVLWIKFYENPRRLMIVASGVALFIFYFLTANYYNYLTQFIAQYNTRMIEKRLLNDLERELISGATVIVPKKDEYEDKIRIYFTQFLQYYYHRKYPIYTEIPSGTTGKICYVTQAMGIFDLYREKTFTRKEQYPLLDWSNLLSSRLQGKVAPIIVDTGAEPIEGYTWYIYTNDIANLTSQFIKSNNLFDLYELTVSSYLTQSGNQEFRAPIYQRYNDLLSQYTSSQGFPINADLSLLGYYIRKLEWDKYKIYLLFHMENPFTQDWKLYIKASVSDDYAKYLPEYRQKDKSVIWNFIPNPPTSQWNKNQYIIVSKELASAPIPYQLELGLFRVTERKFIYYSKPVQLGTIDFKNIAEKFMVFIKLENTQYPIGLSNTLKQKVMRETLQNWQVSQGTRVFTTASSYITDNNIIAVYKNNKKMKLILNKFPNNADEAGIFYRDQWPNGYRIYINDGKNVPPRGLYEVEYK
jgi:hypothetical protein